MTFEGVIDPFADHNFGRNDDIQFDVNGYDDYDSKPKKNKNGSNSKKTLVEVKHEGYILEKAQPLAGERPSWARIGQRPLPFDEKMMIDIVKRHRKSKGTTVDEDYKQLSPNQQAVVSRLLEDRKRREKTKNAEWILYNVQRIGKRTWRSVDVKQLQVILKRIDKTLPLKNGEYTKNAFKTTQYQDFEIIDLAEPTSSKGNKKDKKLKKSKSFDDVFADIDDRNDNRNDPLGIGVVNIPQRDHGRNNNNRGHDHFDNHMPRQSQQFDHIPRQSQQFDQMPMPVPPMHGPPGGFPGDQNPFGQLAQQPLGHQPFGQQPFNPQPHHPQSARQSFSNINPFQPDPNVAQMAQFDNLPPGLDDQVWPHPHQHGRERERARSLSRERRPSARRPSLAIDTGNMRRLENKIDELTSQIQNVRPYGSESDEYEGESVWSLPSARSITPPSSPRSHFSEHKARGSLERRRSSAGRDPRYNTQARYRSHRYRDVEVEPASSYRGDRREYAPEYRRNSQRPKLLHANTFDDYPMGSSAESRLPLAPQPPRPQRRLTDFEDRDRYENRRYDDIRQSDYRDGQDSRRYEERYDDRRRSSRYDAGRRDSAYDSSRRRSTYVGGGGGYYN